MIDDTWWVDEDDLDEDQKKVIPLGLEGNHLLLGPPGSGKTNLLLLRANYLSIAGKSDLVILVFNRPLREFIASGATRYKFSLSKVQTYYNWAKNLLSNHNIDIPESDNFLKTRENLLSGLGQLIDQEKINNKYLDAILLDEAHDYLPEEVETLRKFSSRFFAVADPQQQIYYKDSKVIDYIQTFSETIRLKHHYRNGINICELADLVMKGKDSYTRLKPTSKYKEDLLPSRARPYQCSSIKEQCKIAIAQIETQIKAYPGELIGVICPSKEALLNEVIPEFLNSSLSNACIFQTRESGYEAFDSMRPVCLSSLHVSKGLEYRAVHIIGCETFLDFFKTNRKMTFTGITRAKTSLCLYYSGEIYGYLASALAEINPREDLPAVGEAFGSGD